MLALASVTLFFISAIAAALFLRWQGQFATAAHDAGVAPPAAPSPAPTAEPPAAPDTRPEPEASPTPGATPEKKEAARTAEADKKALQFALDNWVAATNSRDFKRQLSFYAPRLEVFYLSRNVSREQVLNEKRNPPGQAERVFVTVGDPTIEIGRDGLTAVMTFRKKYVAGSGGKRRNGEVVQELRWARNRQNEQVWRITGERDLRVVR